jgi:hypothetical protein
VVDMRNYAKIPNVGLFIRHFLYPFRLNNIFSLPHSEDFRNKIIRF